MSQLRILTALALGLLASAACDGSTGPDTDGVHYSVTFQDGSQRLGANSLARWEVINVSGGAPIWQARYKLDSRLLFETLMPVATPCPVADSIPAGPGSAGDFAFYLDTVLFPWATFYEAGAGYLVIDSVRGPMLYARFRVTVQGANQPGQPVKYPAVLEGYFHARHRPFSRSPIADCL